MVKSRYLCSAPRPETWDTRAEALMKSLGGSSEKIETILRDTLKSLKAMHADKQKTGPGRKSNAEHAIAFYEYVLETIIEKENKDQEGDDENKDSSDATKPPAVASALDPDAPVKRKRGRPRKHPITPPKVVVDTTDATMPNTTNTADDNSILSMDTQEFINQHNDLCEVCSKGGELLMCSTCNLVFHLQCVRPKMEVEPPDSWVCSYCVMSGVKGLKQNSKMRKNAAVAVRLMARMRKQLQRQRQRLKEEEEQEAKVANSDDENGYKKDADDTKPEGIETKPEANDETEASGAMEDEEKSEEEPFTKEVEATAEPTETSETAEKDNDDASDAKDDEEGEHETEGEEVPKPTADEDSNSAMETDEAEDSKPAAKKEDEDSKPAAEEDNDDDPDQAAKEDDQADDSIPAAKGEMEDEAGDDSKPKEATGDDDDDDDSKPAASDDASKPATKEDGSEPASDAKGDEKTNKEDGDAAKKEKGEDAQEAEAEKISTMASEAGSDRTPVRKNSKEPTTSPSKTMAFDDIFSSGGRMRRNRKKATYYDPQSGAASKWQTDGAHEWKQLKSQTSDDDEVDDASVDEGETTKEEKKESNDQEKSEDAEKKTGGEIQTDAEASKPAGADTPLSPRKATKMSAAGTPWCNFCKDDQTIPVCVFCACRVCFGKHEQSKLLLCDRCDDEYHIFCLTPPLKTVPDSGWFCPPCSAAEKAASLKLGTRAAKSPSSKDKAATPGTRTSGRKPISPKGKEPVLPEPVAPPVKRGPGRPRKHPLPPPTPDANVAAPPRKRGRPPKNRSPQSLSPPPKKRGPGRPPKSSYKPAPEPVEPPKKRGPGRPPKSSYKPVVHVEPPPRKRGRPRKHPLPDETSSPSKKRAVSPAPVTVEPPKKRGPGRPRKHPLPPPNPEADVTAPPAKRGRPPKNRSPPAESLSPPPKKRGPGRPPKAANARKRSKSPAPKPKKAEAKPVVQAEEPPSPKAAPAIKEDTEIPAADPVKQPPAVTMSRSGRTVKRTSFHDEIDEGEQHLKSVRYSESQSRRKVASKAKKKPKTEPDAEEEHEEEPEEQEVAEDEAEAEEEEVAAAEENAAEVDAGVQQQASNGGTVHEGEVYHQVAEHQHYQHHGVDVHQMDAHHLDMHDVHFLENMGDVSDMSHLVTLDDNFIVPADHGEHLDVDNVIGSVEPTPVLPVRMYVANQEAQKPAAALAPNAMAAPNGPQYDVSMAETKMAPPPSAPAVAIPPVAPAATVAMAASGPSPPAATTADASAPSEKPPAVAALPEAHAERAAPTQLEIATAASAAVPLAAVMPMAATSPIPDSHAQPAPGAAASADPKGTTTKVPRRKPGARECMQISRRFGVNVIPDKSMNTLLDYCKRGKVEHLIRMRERLDEHSRFLESQLAGLETLVQERGELDIVVPAMPEGEKESGD